MNSSKLWVAAAALSLLSSLARGAVYTVTSAGDTSAGGTLRWAILAANTNPGQDTIAFNLSSPYTIQPTGMLPAVANDVTMDGTTQPGYSGSPIVYLNTASNLQHGLSITGSYVTVKGIKVAYCADSGIYIHGGGFNRVEGCHLISNHLSGVQISGSANNTVGSTNPALRNVLSGNDYDGVKIQATASTNNLVIGNYIGLQASGVSAMGNKDAGVYVYNCSRNRIGGTNENERNIISGNLFGIELAADAWGNEMLGNYIGTMPNGTNKLGNTSCGIVARGYSNSIGNAASSGRNIVSGNNTYGLYLDDAFGYRIRGNYIGTDVSGRRVCSNQYGVYLSDSQKNYLGGTNEGEGNLISGNTGWNVYLAASSSSNWIGGNWVGLDVTGTNTLAPQTWGIYCQGSYNFIGYSGAGNYVAGHYSEGITIFGAYGCRVQGNYVGTDIAGSNALPNETGISLYHATNTLVGGSGAALRNLCSGNSSYGLYISGNASLNNTITNNWIGVDAGGSRSLPNNLGLGINGPSNVIANNVLSGNRFSGVSISDPKASGNVLRGNIIGTRWYGSTVVSNGQHGIDIFQAPRNLIGGTNAGDRNIIGGNGYAGIRLFGSNCVGNIIQGNQIGIDVGGFGYAPNKWGLLFESESSSNLIGGGSAGARNIISSSRENGIYLRGQAHHNQILGNYIGTVVNGLSGAGNEASGIRLEGAAFNRIGSLTNGGGNLIAANESHGIEIYSGSYSNLIDGNQIGLNALTNALPNQGCGIIVANEASNNWVGGTAAGAGNMIAYNDEQGVVIDSSCRSIPVLRNSIYQNRGLGIDLNSDGVSLNDDGDPDLDANETQNYPVILSVSNSGASLRIVGFLNSRTNRSYRLEFFANQHVDMSGYGEGEDYLGARTSFAVTNAGQGFTNTVTTPNPPPNYVTATATDEALQETSEFSRSVLVDTDNDGMPDGFEDIYFGSSTGGNPAGDSDLDHVSNLAEFRQDTDPTDSASHLAFYNLDRSSSGTRLYVSDTSINRQYQLWEDDLESSSFGWSMVGASYQGNGTSMQWTDTVLVTGRIYRISTSPP